MANRKSYIQKSAKRAVKNVARKHPILTFIIICVLIVAVVGGYLYYKNYIEKNNKTDDVLEFVDGELSIHFLELGSYYTGDCTLIKTGNTEILIDAGTKIDAGSKTSSIETVDNYIKNYCTDGKLEYVIVTHAHGDHYACFTTENSLFNRYEIGLIIDFAQTNKSETDTQYSSYKREREEAIDNGAIHYTAKECRESGNYVFEIAESISFTVLDSKYYYEADSSGENNHSVCTLLTHGSRNFLFTGDLELKGEKELVKMNNLPEVELFKAGHHGSKTSSNDCLLSVIKPKRVCVCCCAGSNEYKANNENKFPSQDFVNRVAPYTREVYVTTIVVDDDKKTFTSLNGNIVVCSKEDEISVNCSNNNLPIKDTDWFKNNRTMPNAWIS